MAENISKLIMTKPTTATRVHVWASLHMRVQTRCLTNYINYSNEALKHV